MPETGDHREIIERMRHAAPPGQQLDAGILRELRRLTGELLAARAGAELEEQRFLAIMQRGLALPETELSCRLKGAAVLVTGGTGCIGSALMAQLAQRGPRRLVSVSRGVTTCWPRLAAAEYLTADIRDERAVAGVVREARPDVIFHVAAQRDPGLAETEVHRTIVTNLFGTRNILKAAAAAGTSQVVHASTGKALRPYSTETYAASKRAAEWLMAETARDTGILCSATRFTHVIDNSIVYRRLLAWASPERGEQAVRLHGPDIAFYGQSALESAQLLLCACAGAAPGELRVHAITDLGLPLTLLDLALGVLSRTHSRTPVYFSGYDAGYEQAPFPGLYDPQTAGDLSPLLNAFEAACTTCSPSAMTDSFRLDFAADQRLGKQLKALEEDCASTRCRTQASKRLNELSWGLLDSTLRLAPRQALERSATQARRHWDAMIPGHRRILQSIDDLISQ
jgi:nucleoside-diphosphate-sugar epimerase